MMYVNLGTPPVEEDDRLPPAIASSAFHTCRRLNWTIHTFQVRRPKGIQQLGGET